MTAATLGREAMPDAPRPLVLGMGRFEDERGGLNRYVHELVAAFERAGVESTVVVPTGSSLVRRVAGVAREACAAARRADVVDAHFAVYAAVPVVLRLLGRAPLVVHFHGPWAAESRAAGQRSRSRLAAKRQLERIVYRRAEELVVLSAAFKRMLVEEYGVSPWRVTVVPPGVDLDRFSPGDRDQARRRLGIPPGTPVVLSVRRLVPRMGIDVLLESWKQVVSGRPDALLVVVGEGPLRRSLEQTAHTLGISGSVCFTGSVEEDDLVDWYRAADVAVVPSLELEGYGLVVLEALACGTPVVGTDVLGLREALAPLGHGLVVPAGDRHALAERVRAGLAGNDRFPSRTRCREAAEERSWDRVASRTVEIYDRARGRAGARPLRVVYVDHCARLSGGEIALLRLLPSLHGVDPHVILGEDGPLVPQLLAAGISVEVLPIATAARDLRRDRVRPSALPLAGAWGSAVYVGRLTRRLQRLRPDLVHTNSLKAAIYGLVAAKLAGIPVVWHVRDMIADTYLPAPAIRLVRALAGRTAFVFANSSATLASLGGLGRSGAVVPSSIVYDPAPAPVAVPVRENGARIGMVGRIAPWKGQDVFLRAFAHAFPDGPERAVIIGAPLFDEDEYDRSLRVLAVELGIDGRVEFTGFREDVGSELARLTCLVHASVIPEPFGQVIVEGMAAGLAVVAAAAGGPAEIIGDDLTGLLYPPGDVEALANALRRVAGDPVLRGRLGSAARERVKAFDPDVAADEVLKGYEIALGRSQGGRRAS